MRIGRVSVLFVVLLAALLFSTINGKLRLLVQMK